MSKFASTLATILVAAALVGCGKNNEKPAEGTPVGTTTGKQETAPAGSAAPAPAPAGSAAPAPAPAGSAAPAPAGSAAPAAGDPVAEAKQLFSTVCAACHGATGVGDGPAAASLNPKPRNYSDAEWQKTVKDEEIANAILLGGAGVGKSPMMPPQPQLKDKPEVVAALVQMIRGFGKK